MLINKPQIWNRLNRQHPLARGLACAFYFRGVGDYFDLATGLQALTSSSSKRFVIGRPGPVAEFDGTTATVYDLTGSGYPVVVTSDGAGTGDFTMACWSNPSSESNIRWQFGQQRPEGAYSQAEITANSDSTMIAASAGRITFGTYSAAYGGVVSVEGAVDGDWHMWVGVRRGTDHRLFKDGVVIGTETGTAVSIIQTSIALSIGVRTNFGLFLCNHQIALCAGWNRALTDAEVLDFTLYPDAMRGWPDTHAGSVAAAVAPSLRVPRVVAPALRPQPLLSF